MVDPVGLAVGPILSKVITSVTQLVKEETSLLSGQDGEIKNLSRVLEKIKDVLCDAEVKQIKSSELKSWLNDLRDAAYDAEDVLDLFATKAHLWNQEKKGYMEKMLRIIKPVAFDSTQEESISALTKLKRPLWDGTLRIIVL